MLDSGSANGWRRRGGGGGGGGGGEEEKDWHRTIEDVSIKNEYEYENDFKPYSYSKSFSQLSMLAMTPNSSLLKIVLEY